MVPGDENIHDDISGPLTVEAKRELVERLFIAFNSFDTDGVLELLHPDCNYRVIAAGQIVLNAEGLEAIKALLFEESKQSSSRKKTVMELFSRGEQLILELSYSRVLAISENGKKVGDIKSVNGIAEVRFDGQHIVEYVELYPG